MATVRTRKRGKTYSYIFEAGKYADGRRHVIEKGGFPTKDAAYEAGVSAFTDWKHGNIGITSERITVRAFLELWLHRVREDVRPSTYGTYESCLHTKVIPYIGSIILQELTPARLDRWLLDLKAKGLARSTIHYTKRLLGTALSYAVYPCELIRDNPCRYLKTPKTVAGHHVERVIVTPERMQSLLADAPPGTRCYLPLLLLYHTGMRIGEVLGLAWDDIDLDEKSLMIRHQRVYDAIRHTDYLSAPKTKTSRRKLFLPDYLIETLREEKARQEQNEDTLGKRYAVCCIRDGNAVHVASKAVHPSGERIHFVCIDEKGACVPRAAITHMLHEHGLNSHSFRHTQATVLGAEGVPPATIAARLGHTTVKTTLDIYTHDTEAQQKEIAKEQELQFWERFFHS